MQTLARVFAIALLLVPVGTLIARAAGPGQLPMARTSSGSGGGGGVSGSGVSPRVALWSGAATLTSNAGLTFDGADLQCNATNSALIYAADTFQAAGGNFAGSLSINGLGEIEIENGNSGSRIIVGDGGNGDVRIESLPVMGGDGAIILTSGEGFSLLAQEGAFIGATDDIELDTAGNIILEAGNASGQVQVWEGGSSAAPGLGFGDPVGGVFEAGIFYDAEAGGPAAPEISLRSNDGAASVVATGAGFNALVQSVDADVVLSSGDDVNVTATDALNVGGADAFFTMSDDFGGSCNDWSWTVAANATMNVTGGPFVILADYIDLQPDTITSLVAGDCNADSEVGHIYRYSKSAGATITNCICTKVGSAFAYAALGAGDCT